MSKLLIISIFIFTLCMIFLDAKENFEQKEFKKDKNIITLKNKIYEIAHNDPNYCVSSDKNGKNITKCSISNVEFVYNIETDIIKVEITHSILKHPEMPLWFGLEREIKRTLDTLKLHLIENQDKINEISVGTQVLVSKCTLKKTLKNTQSNDI